MSNKRAGYAFEIAVIVIIVIIVAVAGLTAMLYHAKSNKDFQLALPQELKTASPESNNSENSYIRVLEQYRANEEEVSNDMLATESRVNIVNRKSDIGENSIDKAIDSIVEATGE